MSKKSVYYPKQNLNVRNATIMRRFIGWYKLEGQTNLQLNFLDVLNAELLGVKILNFTIFFNINLLLV